MWYSVGVGIVAYYGILWLVGVLVNATAIESELITIAVVAFIGGYLARNSRLVRRVCNGIGAVAALLVIAEMFLLPILAGSGKTWVTITATVIGLLVYLLTRSRIVRHYMHVPHPPFGVEGLRWIFALVL